MNFENFLNELRNLTLRKLKTKSSRIWTQDLQLMRVLSQNQTQLQGWEVQIEKFWKTKFISRKFQQLSSHIDDKIRNSWDCFDSRQLKAKISNFKKKNQI